MKPRTYRVSLRLAKWRRGKGAGKTIRRCSAQEPLKLFLTEALLVMEASRGVMSGREVRAVQEQET